MGDFECYMGDFDYIITNLVLVNFFNSLSCKTENWQDHLKKDAMITSQRSQSFKTSW